MSQASIIIPTTPPLPGATMVPAINSALAALGTNFAGDTDPAAYAAAYMTWADTANAVLKRRNAANSAWITLGPLFAPGRFYAQGDEPTADIGDIWIDGIGLCHWESSDSKYLRLPFYNMVQTFTASGSFIADGYTKYLSIDGAGGGGAGGRGTGGASGGGAGGQALDYRVTVTPSSTTSVTIGAGGTGNGGNGSSSSFGSLLTLGAGGGGSFTTTAGQTTYGGNGGTGPIPGGRGHYGSNNYFGSGAGSIFGQGGQFTDSTTNDNKGRGYGSGGAGSSASNNCDGAPGIIIVRF